MIYKANQKIIHGEKCTADDEQFLMDFWRLLSDNIIEWQEVLNKTLTKKALRENYIVALAITISAFGKLGRYFYEHRDENLELYLSKLRSIDWLRTNEAWVGRTIRQNGKVLNSEEAISLTCSLIKKSIGISLTKEERQKEKMMLEKK